MARSWHLLMHWFGAAALAVTASTGVAEPAAFSLSDDGARVIRLAENVFTIEHDDATDEWPHGNTGVIVGRSGVFVIDSCYLPSRARAGIIARRRTELQELETLEVVTPTRLFDDRLSLDFEGMRIEIQDRGPANSPNDATIWLPRERILFAGDILVRSPLPYVGASWPVHWARVLREIEAIPIAVMVPGHGPVMKDHSYTRAVHALMDATLARVEAMVRAGRTLAQVQDELNLDDVRARVPEWSGPGVPEEDWTYTRRTLAERAFMGLRGQGGR